MTVEQAIPDEERWPAVPLAYEFARSSYDLMLRRFEVVEGRIRTLVTFAPTFTFAAIVFVRTVRPDASLSALWLMLAVATALLVTLAGAWTMTWGSITVPSPTLIYEKWLHLSEWEFKKNIIYRAGEAFDANRDRLDLKARVANGIAILLFLEIAFLAAWAVRDS